MLGTWESTHETSADGKPTRLTVTRVSDTVFHMEMQEAGFTAYSVDLPDRNVLQLKLVTLAGKS
ncbi:MAG: hypothetical protein HC814_03230 [Rhodobacteraceae bacterium]|nr:hypothetical protein [Paracoccaceae bacterium]